MSRPIQSPPTSISAPASRSFAVRVQRPSLRVTRGFLPREIAAATRKSPFRYDPAAHDKRRRPDAFNTPSIVIRSVPCSAISPQRNRRQKLAVSTLRLARGVFNDGRPFRQRAAHIMVTVAPTLTFIHHDMRPSLRRPSTEAFTCPLPA